MSNMNYRSSFLARWALVFVTLSIVSEFSIAKSSLSKIGKHQCIVDALVPSSVKSPWITPIGVKHYENVASSIMATAIYSGSLIYFECRTTVQNDDYFDHNLRWVESAGYTSGRKYPTLWTDSFKSGTGGVDVTGAPFPCLLVEGTNRQSMEFFGSSLCSTDATHPSLLGKNNNEVNAKEYDISSIISALFLT